MDGFSLKNKIIPLDDSLANTARKLEMTPQSLDNMLKTKDIKSGIIERLAKLYNKPISYFFEEPINYNIDVKAVDHSGASGSGDVLVVNGDCLQDHSYKIQEYENKISEYEAISKEYKSDIRKLEIKVDMLQKLVEDKERIINEKERNILILNKILEQNNITI